MGIAQGDAEPESKSDSVRKFSDDLRSVRFRAKNPKYEALAAASGVSKTVVWEAFAGKRLPSERTLLALLQVMGEESESWRERRAVLEAGLGRGPRTGALALPTNTGTVPTGEVPLSPASTSELILPRDTAGNGGHNPLRPVRMRTVVIIAIVAGVVGIGLGLGGGYELNALTAGAAHGSASSNAAPRISVKTGQDPAKTKCLNDAVVAASETGTDETQLQIIWSNSCEAAWARITRYDGKSIGNEISTRIYKELDPKSSLTQSTIEPGVQSAYTYLLVRPTANTTLCADGWITISGEKIPIQPKICM